MAFIITQIKCAQPEGERNVFVSQVDRTDILNEYKYNECKPYNILLVYLYDFLGRGGGAKANETNFGWIRKFVYGPHECVAVVKMNETIDPSAVVREISKIIKS